MKKFLAMLLALAMVLSMVACGTNNTTDETTSAPTETQGTEPVVETPATYTYNVALSTFPTLWNIHNYETSTDAEIADYITVRPGGKGSVREALTMVMKLQGKWELDVQEYKRKF